MTRSCPNSKRTNGRAADGFGRYLSEARNFPVLDAEAERALVLNAQARQLDAMRALIGSHLRLVVKIARGFAGYGLPLAELVAAGNLGLVRALKGFDPAREVRFASYAAWWIRAEMQELVLQSWSIVRIAKTLPQKRLFFHLRSTKSELAISDGGELSPDDAERLARHLDVSSSEVLHMNRRLASTDVSLDAPLPHNGDGEARGSWADAVVDEGADQESRFIERQQALWRRLLLKRALAALSERELGIFVSRRLSEQPLTLDALARHYRVSRERIRQIEVRALEKVRQRMMAEIGVPVLDLDIC